MNVLSLFDGISCGRVALERAGIPVTNYYASEIDKYAQIISNANYPDIIRLGDVRDWHKWALPKIDILLAGSPCQGFSSAGKQLNFSDPRSALFFEFVDILKELKPKYFLLENVKMKKEWQDVISELLGVEPILINSALVSAQNRNRLYWTNIPDVGQPEDKFIVLADILENGWQSDRCKSYCIDANYGKGSNFKRYFYRGSRQIVFRNGCIPIKPLEINANTLGVKLKGNWRILTTIECEKLQGLPPNYTNYVNKLNQYKAIGNGWTVDVIAHILRHIP